MTHFDLVSIIVPTYNCREYLKEFINSVIAQTYKMWELIIVDDGSVDGTAEMMAHTFRDERIYYYKRPKEISKGVCGSRNFGKMKAKGKFICFFDADDLISDTCIEKRVAYIKKAGVDYCIFPSGVFTDNPALSKKTHVGVKSGIDTLISLLNNYYQYAVWSNIYRTEALTDIWWDEHVKTYEDFDFSVQCILKRLSFEFSDEYTPDYLYRVGQSRETMCTRHVTNEKVNSTIYLFNKVLNTLNLFTHNDGYKKDFIQYHLWYYAQIIRERDKNQEKRFLAHVESAYGKKTSTCFKIARLLFSLISHRQLLRLTIMLYFYIVFRPSRMKDMYNIFVVLFKIRR